jgi:hypothetical protein
MLPDSIVAAARARAFFEAVGDASKGSASEICNRGTVVLSPGEVTAAPQASDNSNSIDISGTNRHPAAVPERKSNPPDAWDRRVDPAPPSLQSYRN